MELIRKHIPNLSETQYESLALYIELLKSWNEKINLVSRKDIDELEEKHILHALAVFKTGEIKPGFKVLDVGTGGGLPGIPLAIALPDSYFVLVDSIGKKITATQDMVNQLGLKNVVCLNQRVESINDNFDIITGRAVTRLTEFYKFTRYKLQKHGKYILLKGGDLKEEIKEFENFSKLKTLSFPLHSYFPTPFFETKFIVKIKKKKD